MYEYLSPIYPQKCETKPEDPAESPEYPQETVNPIITTDKTTLERYDIDTQGINIAVEIIEKSKLPFYKLILPDIGLATTALLNNMRETILESFTISHDAFQDYGIMKEVRREFLENTCEIIKKELPELDNNEGEYLALTLMNETLGLGDLEYFLSDDNIEEIVVNSTKEPVRAYHKKYGWVKTNVHMESEDEIMGYANMIARRVGKEITTRNPRLDAHLVTGDRVNATLNPISNKGHTITIRKFSRNPWTATNFIRNGTASVEVLALLWEAIQYEMNVIISGGTGSGKTSFLNVCIPFIPPTHRIISIEDTKELQLPEFLHWCPLTTREPNPEGEGEVTMLDLLVNSLRMRPDRIVMGEIRRQKEAEVLFEAMHTGHSVYSTLHADSCAQTISRLTNPPINIPQAMIEAVDLNIVMFRDRKTGIRRTLEIGEFIPQQAGQTDELRFKPNILYRWNPKEDKIEPSIRKIQLYDRIAMNTGLSLNEIEEEIEIKKRILWWMAKKEITELNNVGKIISSYYLNRRRLIRSIINQKDPKEILEDITRELSERD